MKIFGHPIHMMLVHFPTALFPMGFICFLLFRLYENTSFLDAGYFAICGGVMMGWLAMIFGLIDVIGLYNTKSRAMNPALLHGGINIVVMTVFTFLAYGWYKVYPEMLTVTNTVLVIQGITIFLMLIGNFLGGRLILKYKVATLHD